MNKTQQINPTDLNTIIMSVVHDVKNSLLLSSATLEQLNPRIAAELHPELDKVQTEIEGINQSLMHMLTLYKMQTDVFTLNRDQYNVYDFLEELLLTNASQFKGRGIHISIECDEYLEWFFDLDLLSNAINTIINNTIRYAQKNVTLRASIKKNFLIINVEDDGIGYPENMVNHKKIMNTQIDFGMNHSGLGLFFAETIARLHCEKDKNGYTRISNLTSGGGCFAICIP